MTRFGKALARQLRAGRAFLVLVKELGLHANGINCMGPRVAAGIWAELQDIVTSACCCLGLSVDQSHLTSLHFHPSCLLSNIVNQREREAFRECHAMFWQKVRPILTVLP